ncbi:MAG: ROK family protein [Specibacter sp.]
MAAIAIDVGGSSFKLALVADGVVLRQERISHSSAANDLEQLADHIRPWIGACDAPLTAVGIAVPGIVRNGVMTSAHDKVGYLIGMDLSGWSKSAFGLPAVIENDARAACWGEFVHGAGRGVTELAVLTVGTGVGTGLVSDGKLVHGAHGHGGILGGHIRIRPDGKPCNCGGRGCIEAEASGWALSRMLRGRPEAREWADGTGFGFHHVLAAAARGSSLAQSIRSDFIEVWALAIANLCQIADPARIVLTGGQMAGAHEILADLDARVRELSWDAALTAELVVAHDVWASATLGIAALAEQSATLQQKVAP